MKFLLVVPRFVDRVGEYYEFPLGLAHISAALKHKGYDVECLNLNHDARPFDLLFREVLGEVEFDVLLIGGISAFYKSIMAVVDKVREVKPDITVVLGGGLLSSEPELVMKQFRAGFGVIGEGEETIVELAEVLTTGGDWSSVQGIAYTGPAGEVVLTPPRPPITDLDKLPWPDYDGLGLGSYLDLHMTTDTFYHYAAENPRYLPMISSRSCPFRCTFCYHPLGNRYRVRSLDGFFAELEYLIGKYNINLLGVLDELLSANKERLKEFCRRIKKYGIKWIAQLRVDSVDAEILGMLKEAGCYMLSYGLESASDVVLQSMCKKITLKQIENALQLTRDMGTGIQGNFIFGDVAETWETAMETLAWWEKHFEYQISLGFIIAYPGTQLYNIAVERGIIKDKLQFLEDGCPCRNISAMSDEEFDRLSELLKQMFDRHRIVGKEISSKFVRTDPVKGDIYQVVFECPHCHSKVEHGEFNVSDVTLARTACTTCNQRFDILSVRERQMAHALASVPAGRMAAWGASTELGKMLSTGEVSPDYFACIFDNDRSKHGTTFHGVRIMALPQDVQEIKSMIDGILICTRSKGVYGQIAFLADHGVGLYRLFGQ